MKQIKVNLIKYLEAPIDDKNVLSDSIIENLFDDGNYVWERNEAVGFIVGYPCLASYCGNTLRIKMVQYRQQGAWNFGCWAGAIVERVTGSPYKRTIKGDNNITLSLLNNEVNKELPEEQLISSFYLNYDEIVVSFYWNQKK